MDRSEWKQYILETYHAVSDRPWPRYPNHEVFRHPGNRKWFALMMEVPGAKLGLPERGMLDILNLKCDPVLIASLRGAPGLLPAYHMNKENWITAVLDSGAPDAQIRTLLAMSYDMTAPGRGRTAKNATRIRQRPGICGKISVSNSQEAHSMAQWHRNIQDIITIMDGCIRTQQDEALTLRALADRLGYSEYYTSRRFRALAGMTLRDYLRLRRLAFALRDVRDTDRRLLDIAVQYGFSSNEAFARAFKKAYGVSPSAYRAAPGPVVLQTILRPFDCYLTEGAGDRNETQSAGEVRTYFVHIPAHKFLHIRNYESIGYWDFWRRQSAIPGQDCETICGLLASIPGKLDDAGGENEDAGSGQLMAWINEPTGRICSWGIPLAEAYGVRLPAQMQLMDVPAGEYLVLEHGPFDFETQNAAVEAKVEQTMRDFDYAASGWQLDLTPGRVFYFYHDCARFFKYVRPACRA